MKQSFIKNIIFFVILNLVISPLFSQAAILGVQSLSAQVAPGKNFTLRVSVNTQGKTINNAEAVVRFPTDLVQVVSVNSGGIFSLWVEPPAFSNSGGTISFNGGVPNPGYVGSGQILTATFKAKKAGTAKFTLSGAAVRENDGLGTNILTGQGTGSILIIDEKTPEPEKKPSDKTEPEPILNLSAVTITSVTHPDSNSWYNVPQAIFAWTLPSGVSATQTSLDQNPEGIPTILRRPAIRTITIDSLKTGVWYFHARYLIDKTWSKTATYKIQVDTVPPERLEVSTKTNESGNLVAVMSAADKDSQIANYTVQIDSQLPLTVPALIGETTLVLPPVAVGTHSLNVNVFDKAGNSLTKVIQFENKESPQVIITKYKKEIKENERIEIFGLAPSESILRVSLVASDGLTRYYYIKSTGNGEFTFSSEPIGTGGMYSLWVELDVKEGQPTLSSEHIQIIVKDSVISITRNWFTSLQSLITWSNTFIIFFLVLALIGWYKYFSLRRLVRKGSKSKK